MTKTLEQHDELDTTMPLHTAWYRLQPVDAWFFRDSRPSNAGEDQTDLQSLFPPNHDTVIGGIRAALARQLGWSSGPWAPEITAKLGDGFEDLSPLSFTGPFLEITPEHDSQPANAELLFPMPGHVLGEVKPADAASNYSFPSFIPTAWIGPSEKPIVCDRGSIHLPVFPQGSQENSSGMTKPRLKQGTEFFVTSSGMQKIIEGQLPNSEDCIHKSRLFVHERRIGIQRDQTMRTTSEGGMYSPQFVRLREGVSLVMGVDGLDPNNERLQLPGLFPLGGESRMAACERIDQPPTIPVSQEGDVLLLATPACFAIDSGSSPDAWVGVGPGGNASRLAESLGSRVVITCLVDRPQRIGGADSRVRGAFVSRPLVPYVASGAVWWMSESASLANLELLRLGNRISHGYGMAFIAKRPTTNN